MSAESVSSDVVNEVYLRAQRRCQCEGVPASYLRKDAACDHRPGECGNDLSGNWGVAVPEGAAERDFTKMGRAHCSACFQNTGSYIRQDAWKRPRFLSGDR